MNQAANLNKTSLCRYIINSAKAFFRRLCEYDAEQKAVFIVLLCSFFHMLTSVLCAFIIGIYMLFRKDIPSEVFRTGKNGLFFAFLALTFVVSAINLSVVGLLACTFTFFLSIIMIYAMQNMTVRFFEDVVTIYLSYSVLASVIAMVEYICFQSTDAEYRCASTFSNPLYYSYFITIAVLFCTYRIIAVSRYRRIYVPILVLNAIGMVLSGSRMPWVGMFIGLFLILMLKRQYKMIAVFAVFIGALLVLFVLFPNLNIFAGMRLNKIDVSYEGRKPYWDFAIRGIFDKPFFGHGMIGMLNDTMKQDSDYILRFLEGNGNFEQMFMLMKHHGWKMHAHNIILDSLYSYGIIGTFMIFVYGMKKGINFFRNCGYSGKNPQFALLCSIVVCIGINGIVDCELIGLQTIVFSFLVFSMVGLFSSNNNANIIYKLEPQKKE